MVRLTGGLLAVVVFSFLPACGGSCEATVLAAPGETAAATEALSCPEVLSYQGIDYVPWCSPIPETSLGENLASNFEGQFRYVLRPIQGVPLEDAVAIHSSARINVVDGGSPRIRRCPHLARR